MFQQCCQRVVAIVKTLIFILTVPGIYSTLVHHSRQICEHFCTVKSKSSITQNKFL